MSRRLALVLAALASCWLAPPRTAQADTATLTRFFDDQARAAFAKREYQSALEYFLLVDRATPSPGAAYNVAVTAHTAGEVALAFAYLERYLASDDDDQARRSDAERRAAELRGKLALVRVESEPSGAQIFVDLREHGALGETPRTIVVQPGVHQILLESPRHLPARASVTAEIGGTASVQQKLVARTGGLAVTTAPPGTPVDVLRSGALVRQLAAGATTQLPIGRYQLRMAPAGYHPAETVAVVEEGATRTAHLVARPLPPKTGALLVTTGSVTAELYLDGKLTAKTPATLRDVPVGQRSIELRARGYRNDRRRVTIVEDEAAFLKIELDRAAKEAR
ncbi:MAG: PEGA domain-containing protein [Deltaproteobacteria bacterium]|jgi:hypothetical protein|nr:PEGA domain-containing protein [Deltaproteobacteria bacterium]MBW2535569.1 PEGA domain-containing protein [Deltaproteobacteria bacterium]